MLVKIVSMIFHACSDLDLLVAMSMFICVPIFVVAEVATIAQLSFQCP